MLELSLKEQKQINGGFLYFVVTGIAPNGGSWRQICRTVDEEHEAEAWLKKNGYTNITVSTKRSS